MQHKLYSFSPSGGKLSHIGPDGMIRIWDTATGILEHEYQPASHLTAKPSCIQYSPQTSSSKKGKKAQQKEKSSLLAVATHQGTVLLYSPEKKELLATLDHSQPQPVVDLAWLSPTQLCTLSADNTVVRWNVLTGEKEACVEVSGGSALCVLCPKSFCTAKSRIELNTLKKKDKVKVKKIFTGHTTLVGQLLPLPTSSDPTRYFLSASLDDRFVYAWDRESESEEPVASFSVKDSVTGVEAIEVENNTVTIAVTTKKGSLVLFRQHLNGNASNRVIKRTGQLTILQEGKDNVQIPVVAAYFCGDSEGSLIIAYGNSSILKFERIKTTEISGIKKVDRTVPVFVPSKKSSLAETVTPKVNNDSTVVGPGHTMVANESVVRKESKRKHGDEDGKLALPMDERLNALELDRPIDMATAQPPKMDNQIHLLLQGLHSKDAVILQSVLNTTDETMMTNTVRRLPTPAVIPLLKHLQTLFTGKGHKGGAYVTWVRLILYHHMGFLSSLPDRQELMRPFYANSASRVDTLMELTQLHARLDLSLTHVATKHQEAQQEQLEPCALLLYNEDESDIEEPMEHPAGISESEDNWEELSDFGDLNGHSDSESNLEDNLQSHSSSSAASKHTLEEEDESELTSGSESDMTVEEYT